ncbi:sigma 54-interacting transcriptional regulator, partial [Myxococcota bacterium]|nr:sigma 54-interacting transcriptional regulator [Myxococcota bacterium]
SRSRAFGNEAKTIVAREAPLLLYTHPTTGELLRRRWHLAIVDERGVHTRTEITDSPALVGAAPAATLVLTDDTVSRYHAELDVFAEGLRLRDLDSTNGTFVHDERVQEAFVESGDVFRVGRTEVSVLAEDEPAASEIDTDPKGVPPGAIETLGHALAVAGATRDLLRLVKKIAPSESPVLFEGEVGTGKATLARLLHDLSPRRELPFVSISPRAIGEPGEIHARLFGRAATRGVPARPGLFELARGGTLFVEGVEHLPRALQPELLETIETGELRGAGARTDVRIVSSSERRLATDEAFDARLARRLAVVRLRVPPLRERTDDIRALAEHFLELTSGRSIPLGARTLDVLRPLSFPGNLDQLRRLVSTLVPEPRAGLRTAPELGTVAAELKLAFVCDRLEANAGSVTKTAAELARTDRELFQFLTDHRVDLDAG